MTMSHTDYITEILGINDAEIEKVENGATGIRIRFHLRRRGILRPHCGELTNIIHDCRLKELCALPLQGKPLRLEYRRMRYLCRKCGKKSAENWPDGISARQHV